MHCRPGSRVWLVVAAVAALAACSVRPLPPAGSSGEVRAVDIAALGERWFSVQGQAYAVDAGESHVWIRVYRAGRLAHLGHNHVLAVADLNGRLLRTSDGGAVADLQFRVDRLTVDEPAVRARMGDDFAAQPNEQAMAGTRRNLLSAAVLNAERWPRVRALGRIDSLAAPHADAVLVFEVVGQARRIEAPLTIEHRGDTILVRGTVTLRQSDFGIQPFAVLGGALQVRDAIEADFTLVGRPSGAAL